MGAGVAVGVGFGVAGFGVAGLGVGFIVATCVGVLVGANVNCGVGSTTGIGVGLEMFVFPVQTERPRYITPDKTIAITIKIGIIAKPFCLTVSVFIIWTNMSRILGVKAPPLFCPFWFIDFYFSKCNHDLSSTLTKCIKKC